MHDVHWRGSREHEQRRHRVAVRRGEGEEEVDDRWGLRVSERETGGTNCGSGAPDVKMKISLSSTGCNRSAVSYCLISPNQSVFWQTVQNEVSASKRPSLSISARQLSLFFSYDVGSR